MSAVPHYYRLHDAEPRGAMRIDPLEAKTWNSKGFGIYWAVNFFRRGERRIENLERINAWAIDIDDGTKAEQRKRISESPLIPTFVVETKRGHQVYWRAKDACAAHWNAIVVDRLVPWYGADRNARDLARILRVPGYLHLKDPADPFLVQAIWDYGVSYTEAQMGHAYPYSPKVEQDHAIHREAARELPEAGGFWDRLWHLDCEAGLERLSGHAHVCGEHFTFRRNRSGTKAILCDGKSTSAWIDTSGRIGSFSKGGPTLLQWLCWYGVPKAEAVQVLKDVFPELTRG